MVILQRQIVGLLRYRKVWFPTRDAARAIGQALQPNDVVRFSLLPRAWLVFRARPLHANRVRLAWTCPVAPTKF